MKVIKTCVLMVILATTLLCGCGKRPKYTRNPDYVYGEIPEGDLSSLYELTGEPTHKYFEAIISFDTSETKRFDTVTQETADGGVVCFGGGKYVYSPDKNEKNGVEAALSTEFLSELIRAEMNPFKNNCIIEIND